MVDYHPFSDAIFDDPYPTYKRLRDESPVHYLEEFDCWFLSRFEDVWNLEQDQRNLTSKFGTTSTHLVTKQTPISPNLSGLDPPQHGPVRSFFNPPFKPGAVAALEPRVRAFARAATLDVPEGVPGGAVAARAAPRPARRVRARSVADRRRVSRDAPDRHADPDARSNDRARLRAARQDAARGQRPAVSLGLREPRRARV